MKNIILAAVFVLGSLSVGAAPCADWKSWIELIQKNKKLTPDEKNTEILSTIQTKKKEGATLPVTDGEVCKFLIDLHKTLNTWRQNKGGRPLSSTFEEPTSSTVAASSTAPERPPKSPCHQWESCISSLLSSTKPWTVNSLGTEIRTCDFASEGKDKSCTTKAKNLDLHTKLAGLVTKAAPGYFLNDDFSLEQKSGPDLPGADPIYVPTSAQRVPTSTLYATVPAHS